MSFKWYPILSYIKCHSNSVLLKVGIIPDPPDPPCIAYPPVSHLISFSVQLSQCHSACLQVTLILVKGLEVQR